MSSTSPARRKKRPTKPRAKRLAQPPFTSDRLLSTLDVEVKAFDLCQLERGHALKVGSRPFVTAYYVIGGTLHFQAIGMTPLVCRPGDLLLVPPRIGHQLSSGSQPARTVIDAATCAIGPDSSNAAAGGNGPEDNLQLACGNIEAHFAGTLGLLDTIRSPIVTEIGDDPFVGEIYRAMLREVSRPTIGSRSVTSTLMKACLLFALREYFCRSGDGLTILGALHDPRLGLAINAVLDSPGARHTVHTLAGLAGMSRSAFARDFTNTFAVSPMVFVSRTRLNGAAALLRGTRLPIKAIAAKSGFSSRSHFSMAFSGAYGVAPSKYRSRLSVTQAPVNSPLP